MSRENLEIARAVYPGEVDLVVAFERPELIAQTGKRAQATGGRT